jgi:uncharacterized cupin superfamily protein
LIQSGGLTGRQANVEGCLVLGDIKRISLAIIGRVNMLSPTWDAEVDAGGSILRAVRLAQHAGAQRLAANLYELDPGAVVAPLHFHHTNEELLIVIAGTPTLRSAVAKERTLAPGEVVSFPVGPSGTHQVLNRSEQASRVLICATNELPEVAEQVENDTVAVITSEGLRLMPAVAPTLAP